MDLLINFFLNILKQLPSSISIARFPSGDSPIHATLYWAASGKVSDLLLKEQMNNISKTTE